MNRTHQPIWVTTYLWIPHHPNHTTLSSMDKSCPHRKTLGSRSSVGKTNCKCTLGIMGANETPPTPRMGPLAMGTSALVGPHGNGSRRYVQPAGNTMTTKFKCD